MNKIYGIKNCGSVKKALEWFVARDLPFEFHDFRKEGIDPVLLDEWIAKTSCDVLLRKMHKSTLETHHQPIMPVLALVLATFFWGSSFITVGSALEYTNPLTLVMLRFGVAAFFVLLMLKGRIADIPKRTWKAGAACAFLIYLGYTTNAAGLMTLQSSESGFLTALYVPITPLLVWVVFGKAPTKGAVFGVMMAFAGLVLLANPFTLSFSNNWGEWVTILSALISAVEIMVVGRVAPGTQARQLAFTQLFFTAVFAAVGLAVATAAGVPLKETTFNTTVVGGILWLAVIVAFVQVLLSWAQRYVPASRAAVIFAMESVFAAIIGWFAGESLGTAGIIGGVLIVGGILCGEIRLPRRKAAPKELSS